MKLHAGSLYKEYLILYSGTDEISRVIKVPQEETQWMIYCEDVEFNALNSTHAEVTHKNLTYRFEYFESDNPMRDLGFS